MPTLPRVNGCEPVEKHWLQQAARASCRPHVQQGMQGNKHTPKGPPPRQRRGNTVMNCWLWYAVGRHHGNKRIANVPLNAHIGKGLTSKA